jgi:GT2 family glycosyltransferase
VLPSDAPKEKKRLYGSKKAKLHAQRKLLESPLAMAELYNAYYYEHDCGLPYERNEHWLQQFANIADEIVRGIRPTTVMDAGCAMGFLVEMLREHRVEAFGRDISAYAIEHVHPDIRDYCEAGSITDPFPQTYDLIVCIEVLEHMTTPEARQAVENMCQYTDDILFSSTPFDYREVTHFNVRPPEYWSTLFAHHGFYRDVDFDGSFITPWTVRFRRLKTTLFDLFTDYERRFWQLWKENVDVRSFSLEVQQRLATEEAKVKEYRAQLDATVKEYRTRMDEATNIIAEVSDTLHKRNLSNIALNHQLAHKEQQVVSLSEYLESVQAQAQQTHQQLVAEKQQISHSLQVYSDELQHIIAQKNEHIRYLENIIKQIESGQMMRLLQSFNTLRSNGPSAAIQTLRKPPAAPTPDQPAETTCQRELNAYERWIATYEPRELEIYQQRKQAETFVIAPLISFITPVYNPDPEVLRETIESVLAQTYPRWELCLADGNSTRAGVKEVLDAYAHKDSRIRVNHLPENRGISGNSNEAMQMSRGEFLALLDHDDLLSPAMLYEVVKKLNEKPDADIIYFDEDKKTGDGKERLAPIFKPHTWSPDHLLATNYLMHSVIRRSLVFAAGGFDSAMDGAQDWDLLLRCVEQTDRIYHVPQVLYHWRQVENSAALSTTTKPWAFKAQALCVAAHLKRIGIETPRVTSPEIGRVRVIWPMSTAKVSIIIPTKDKPELLRACLSSLLKYTTYPNYEIILVDTGSTQRETLRYYEELQAEPNVRLVEYPHAPFNFSATNNFGAGFATGDMLLFLNNDTEVLNADWLEEMAGWMERPGVGVVGAKLIRPDETIQHAGVVIGLGGHASHVFDGCSKQYYSIFGSPDWYRNYQAVTGACLMIRRELFATVGGFDEAYLIGYSDTTLCLAAIEQGYRVVYTPFACLLHHEGGSRGYYLPPSDVLRAYGEMQPAIEAGDPYFNPNLSYLRLDPDFVQADEMDRNEHLLHILRAYDLIASHADDPRLTATFHPCVPLAANKDEAAAVDLCSRILLVTDHLDLSDAPLQLLVLAKFLVTQGYTLAVVSPKAGMLQRQFTDAGIEVLIEPLVLDDARMTCSLLQTYGMVVANTVHAWRSVYAARAVPRPCIWWLHDPHEDQHMMDTNDRLAAAVAVADAVVLPSPAIVAMFADRARDNLVPVPYSLDAEITDNYVNTFQKKADTFMVVTAAPVEVGKGQDVLLRSIEQLPAEMHQQMEVYLVGPVREKKFYEQLRKDFAHLDNVFFVGEVAADRMSSYIQSADVLVLPGRDEEYSPAVLEAMYRAKPVVASDSESIQRILVHASSGRIFKVGHVAELANHLTELFNNPELRETLGNGAREACLASLTIEHTGQQFLNLIKHHGNQAGEADAIPQV